VPRAADPDLPHRILKAADTLWQARGEEGITIRGMAAAAKTTTPTVYSYYADREALLAALRAVAYLRFVAHLTKAADFQDLCERYLDYGERHARDYELLYGRAWGERVTPDAQSAEIAGFARELVKAGVEETRAMETAYPIVMMLHSLVMSRLRRKPSALALKIRAACLAACVTLMENARRKR
jgi:AcrR family transcriptional regulator